VVDGKPTRFAQFITRTHLLALGDLLVISRATPSPLYYKHPHVFSGPNHPVSIETQARLAMENIKSISITKG
jgi:hypothetical protein